MVQHKNVRFWAYNAGHVLGAAMFMLEIGGRHILYTGDYSMEDDRHLAKAEIPKIKPDLLICESTYGIQVHQVRMRMVERAGKRPKLKVTTSNPNTVLAAQRRLGRRERPSSPERSVASSVRAAAASSPCSPSVEPRSSS